VLPYVYIHMHVCLYHTPFRCYSIISGSGLLSGSGKYPMGLKRHKSVLVMWRCFWRQPL